MKCCVLVLWHNSLYLFLAVAVLFGIYCCIFVIDVNRCVDVHGLPILLSNRLSTPM